MSIGSIQVTQEDLEAIVALVDSLPETAYQSIYQAVVVVNAVEKIRESITPPEIKLKPSKVATKESYRDQFAKALFGQTATSAVENNQCVSCKGLATEFVDLLSAEEYRISGLCQGCQDGVFGNGP